MKCNSTKKFNAILKNVRNTKLISVKSHGSNINLHALIIKLINAEKALLKKGYAFVKVFDIFDEIDNKCNKLNEYNCRTPNKNDAKNLILQYFKIMEDRLIDMPSTPSII